MTQSGVEQKATPFQLGRHEQQDGRPRSTNGIERPGEGDATQPGGPVNWRGMNDDEAVAFARRTRDEGWNVRFIEVMPLGAGEHWSADSYVSSAETRARIEEALGPLEPATLEGSGPARYWRLPGAGGVIGFISPISEHFCAACNRLRLTADGKLMPCLLSDRELDLRALLRGGADDAALRDLLLRAVAMKPDRHHLDERIVPETHLMSQVGG